MLILVCAVINNDGVENIYRYASNGVYLDDSLCYSLDIVSECKEPEYIPLSWETRNIIREKGGWLKCKGLNAEYQVVHMCQTYISLGNNTRLYWLELLDKCEFLDGTPCGILK